MKKIIFLFLLVTFVIYSQKNGDFLIEVSEMKLFIEDIKLTEIKLNDILKTNDVKIESLNKDLRTAKFTATIHTTKNEFKNILFQIEKLGDVYQHNKKTISNRTKMENVLIELKYYYKLNNDYEMELSEINKKRDRSLYNKFFKEKKDIERKIFELEKEKLVLKNEVNQYVIKLNLEEKKIYEIPTKNKRAKWFDFVNMPGVESIYLRMENPLLNKSSINYMGMGVKYLFTEGKSYLNFGTLKTMDTISEKNSQQAKDIFYYGYGHDFFPRYMGGGNNKYLNLYSGFSFGGSLIVSEDSIDSFPLFVPHIGLELVKSKYFLIDTKAGYYIPISEKLNYNYRGFSLNTSLNFVF